MTDGMRIKICIYLMIIPSTKSIELFFQQSILEEKIWQNGVDTSGFLSLIIAFDCQKQVFSSTIFVAFKTINMEEEDVQRHKVCAKQQYAFVYIMKHTDHRRENKRHKFDSVFAKFGNIMST